MANITYALTSTDRVKNRIAIDSTDTTRDTVIKRMIYSATQFIEHACGGVRFERTTYTNEVYDGSPKQNMETSLPFLILKNSPVISISSFQYRTGSRSNPTWVSFATDDYEPDNETAMLRVWGGLPRGLQNIRVSYVAGYLIDFANEFDGALHTLPFEVSDLCERLVTKLLKRRESEGRSQESFNNSSINWGAFLEAHDREILANFRRVFAV